MPGVSHTVKCGRTAYGPAAQAVQCMASLRASEFESPDRKPVDLVLVIDKSGSMNGAKMVLTKETAELVVRELGPTDRLAIVAYDTDVSCDLGLCLMDSRGKAAARAKIAGIRPGSCTNLSGGLLRGLEELGAEGGAETASVLLLTDGLANRGIMGTTDIVRVVEGVTRDSSNPPSVFTFGYGADHNAEMLRAISDAGNGQYYFMEDGDAVATSFADALGGLLSVVAQNVRLTLGCHGGAVTRVLGKAYSSTISEGTIELSIGDLYSEEAKDILFEVFIPPGVPALSEVAIVATISYLDVVQGKIVSGVAAQAQIARAAEDGAADIEVAEHMNRTDCAQALLMAGGLGAQGQYAAARALLSEAMTKLTVSAAKDSPLTVQLVADMQEALDGFRDARSYRSKGSYDCQSMQQAHSKQRSNKAPKGGRAAWAAGDDAVGASPYMTKSKRAMAVRWSSSPMEPPVAPATPVVEPPAVALTRTREQGDDAQHRQRRRAARFDSPAIRVMVLIHPTTNPKNRHYGVHVMDRTRHLLQHAGGGHTAKCTVTEVTGAEICDGTLRDADVLYVPGGSVFLQQRVLGIEGYTAIVSFVRSGGGYVGVCAGALLAGWGVEDVGGILGASTEFTGWTAATIATVALTDAGRRILGDEVSRGHDSHAKRKRAQQDETAVAAEESATVDLVLTGGSWHVPSDTEQSAVVEAGLPSSVAITRFEPLCELLRVRKADGSEVPPERWGAAAPAVAGSCGAGRVVVIGPHPESQRSDVVAHRWLGEAVYWASRKGILEQ